MLRSECFGEIASCFDKLGPLDADGAAYIEEVRTKR
jgi:hypothetical protein